MDNPYIHTGKVPLRTELGGREMTLLFNGIKMISSFEVGYLTLDIVFADSKVRITDISNNEKRTINEYPIEKLKEAKKEFHKLTQQRLKNKKAKIKAIDLQELLPRTNTKDNFMLVVQLNEALIIYDLRGEEPREVMRFPNNQYKKARIELLKLEVESKKG
jgi:hypothetical protein